jgi:hypothetical protein
LFRDVEAESICSSGRSVVILLSGRQHGTFSSGLRSYSWSPLQFCGAHRHFPTISGCTRLSVSWDLQGHRSIGNVYPGHRFSGSPRGVANSTRGELSLRSGSRFWCSFFLFSF